MSLEGILIGLFAIAIGLAWAFYGLKLFVLLLPIWAFFFGLVTGAQWASEVFGKGDAGFFITTLSWIIGIVFGLVLAAIAFFWYYAAVVIMVGALGYMLGVGFFEWLGFGTGLIALVVGLLLGAVFAVAAFLLGVPALLVVVVSAFSGAAAVVNGIGILVGRIKVEELSAGIFGSLMHNADGVIAMVAMVLIAAAAIWYQLRGVEEMATARIDRSQYRYA
jgi:Domain of unknown function (DUF4203)